MRSREVLQMRRMAPLEILSEWFPLSVRITERLGAMAANHALAWRRDAL